MSEEYTIKDFAETSRKPNLQHLIQRILGDAHSIDGLLRPENSLGAVADPLEMNAAKVVVLDRISRIEGRLLELRKVILGAAPGQLPEYCKDSEVQPGERWARWQAEMDERVKDRVRPAMTYRTTGDPVEDELGMYMVVVRQRLAAIEPQKPYGQFLDYIRDVLRLLLKKIHEKGGGGQ